VAGTIAEEVFSYEWTEISGGTPITYEAVMKGEIDVHMEIWTDNLPDYDGNLAAGKFKELSTNFDDNMQGIYVPRYVIEGDASRGIEPMAPELKTVEDLKKYPEVFKDPEDPSKGRLYGALPGWAIDKIMYNKYMFYGLDETFTYFQPGTDAAMSAAMVSAYDKGEAIAAYYWEPTWLLGKYDFVLLEDAPYQEDLFQDGKCACPAVPVMICVSNQFAESNPEFCEFLSKYETSSALCSEALAYMQETGSNYADTAKWFLGEHSELVDEWLTADQAQKLREAL
jgi:glycine betaine/proline transport system permease protein/glycine betaine/proline transport system substrate-binding protein